MRLAMLLGCLVLIPALSAAEEHEGHGGRERHEGRHEGHERVEKASAPAATVSSPAANEAYAKTCGACHLAYPPWLLPEASWVKILVTPSGHAGGELSLTSDQKTELKSYLTANSATKSTAKRAGKIAASVGGDLPTRVSDVPYLRNKHREIGQEVFSRKSVGSRGNCAACHASAARGEFDDDDVTIPK